MLVVAIVIAVVTPVAVTSPVVVFGLVAIAGSGPDGRATSPAYAGADQATGIATHALADGGAPQGTDGPPEGSLILVAPVGRGRAARRGRRA